MKEFENMERDLLEALPESLSECLDTIEGMRINGISRENVIGKRSQTDVIINITFGDCELKFVAVFRSDVYPRDAREVLWRLKQCSLDLNSLDRGYIPMLVAQSISDGARMILQEERIAYHDLCGAFFFNTGEKFVLVEGHKSRRMRHRDVNLFRGTRAQVLHALYSRPDEWVSGTETAENAGVSPATVSQTFKCLERRDWLEVKGEGPAKRRRLSQPGALLDAWRDGRPEGRRSKRVGHFVPGMKPDDMARKIAQVGMEADIDLEFTGQYAAQIYTPFLSTVSVLTVRVGDKQLCDKLLTMLDARRVSMGSNLVVIDARNHKLSRRMRGDEENPMLASPLQVYLDLLEDHGRSQEMAAHLRTHKLALQ